MSQGAVVTWEQRYSASIDAYASDIQNIWRRDLKRPVLFQWLGVVSHASALVEEVRKSAWGDVALQLAEVFVWWLSFINRINKAPNPQICKRSDLNLSDAIFYLNCPASDIVWSKFPNVCPVCFGYHLLVQEVGEEFANNMIVEERRDEFDKIDTADENISEVYRTVKNKPCECLARKQLIEKRSEAFKDWVKERVLKLAEMKKDTEKPQSLKDLEGSLSIIFQPNISLLSADEIAFHLLEEVGEVSRALGRLHLQPHKDQKRFLNEHRARREAVREELADVFSWIVTMRVKCYSILMCAADFTEKRIIEEYAKDTVRKYLTPASNLVELLWNVYARFAPFEYKDLRCEVCGKRPCNPRHKEHVADRGELFGDNVKPFFNQIKSLRLGFGD